MATQSKVSKVSKQNQNGSKNPTHSSANSSKRHSQIDSNSDVEPPISKKRRSEKKAHHTHNTHAEDDPDSDDGHGSSESASEDEEAQLHMLHDAIQ